MIQDELIVNGVPLDLNEIIPVPINMSINDLKEPQSRVRSLSKEFVLPYSQTNYNFFVSNFSLTDDGTNFSFNPVVKANAIYKKKGLEVLPNGVIQLKEVVLQNEIPSFKVVIYSEVVDWFLSLTNIKVQDLDWSGYNHTLSRTNIKNSWLAAAGTGYYYPLIERGNSRLGTLIWRTTDLVPYVYLKECITKMLTFVGIQYDSNFIDSARFENILFGYGGGDYITNSLSATEQNSRKILTSGGDISYSMSSNNLGLLKSFSVAYLNSIRLSITEDQDLYGQLINSASFTEITIQRNGNYRIGITGELNVTFTATSGSWQSDGRTFVYVFKNGVQIDSYNSPVGSNYDFNIARVINFNASSGDVIRFMLWTPNVGWSTDVDVTNVVTTISDISIEMISTDTSVTDGSTIELGRFIPDMLCSDLLVSVMRHFNWQISDPDIYGVTKIEPLSDFYQGTNVFEDISDLVDISQDISIKPIANEYAKSIAFKFKSVKDFDFEAYFTKYGKVYGDYTASNASYYAKGEQKIELSYSTIIPYEIAPSFIVPRFITKDNSGTIKPTDNVARVMYRNGLKTGTFILRDSVGTGEETITSYPCVHHFNNYTNPTFDLNFALVSELFHTASIVTTTNAYSEYSEDFINEITSAIGKLVTLYVHWYSSDVTRRDFSKLLMYNGSLFRLNKILDFDENISNTVKLELIKVLEAKSKNRKQFNPVPIRPSIISGGLIQSPLSDVGTGVAILNGGSKGQVLKQMKRLIG